MKHDWEWRSFEACLEKVIYTKKLQSSDYLSEGKHPVVSQEEGLISGFWNNDDDIFEITKPLVIFGDHTRVLKYINFNFVLGADGVKILQPIDDIRAKFLYYYLKWFNVPSLGYSRHYKLLKECSVPVPSLSVQQQIVSELDKVSEIIEKKKQQVKELDNLAQSIFYDMFGDPVENEKGWEVKKTKDFGEVKIGPFGSLLHKSDYISGGIPLVNPIHMRDGKIFVDNNFTISESKAKELSSYLMQEGDFVFARRGEIGRCAIVRNCDNGCLCGTGSLFVRFSQMMDRLFLRYVVNSKSFVAELVDKAKGATMLNINCGIVEELRIPNPPLSLQQAFAEKVEGIERQKELITASIKEAETLFDSRMEYWFGE